MTRLPARDVALVLLVAALWGMGYVVAKGAMAQFPPILLMALRYGVAVLVLAPFAGPPRGQLPRLALISVIGATAAYALTFSGLQGMDAGLGALVVQLEVPFMLLFAWLLWGERITGRQGLGVTLAFVGVAAIVGQVRLEGALTPVLLTIAGAATWAFGQASLRRVSGLTGVQTTAWIAVLAVPQLFVASALIETGQWAAIRGAGPSGWAAVIYLGLIMTAAAYALWNGLMMRHEVADVAPFMLLLPVFSILGGMIFLGETPGVMQLLGGAVILAGLALITLRARA